MAKVVNVYLKHPTMTGTVGIKAEAADNIDGFLYVIPSDPDQPYYAFNMDHVIYWTSKEMP